MELLEGLVPAGESRKALESALSGKPADLVFEHPAPDSPRRRLLAQFDPGQADSAAGILVTLVDITSAVEPAPSALRPTPLAELMDGLLGLIPYPVFIKDTDGRYMDCNANFCEFAGVARNDLVGRMGSELWPAHYADVYRATDLEVLGSGGVMAFETSVLRHDGEPRRMNVRKTVVHDRDGKAVGIVGVMLDMTQLREVEAALLKGEEKMRAFMRFVPAAVVMFDPAGRVLLSNAVAAAGFGVPEAWMLGRDFRDFLTPDAIPRFSASLAQVLENASALTLEVEVDIRQGHRSLLVTYFPVMGGGATVEAVGFIALDLTARRQAERHQRFMFENMPYGMAWRRMDGSYTEANAAALDILGLGPGELTGSRREAARIDAYDPEGKPVPFEGLPSERVLRTGQAVRNEIMAIKRGGKVRWTMVDAYPVKDDSGRLAEAFITLGDVSALHEESSLKDDLIREIHHRVKNNLALVAGLLSITASRAAPGARADLADAEARVRSVADLYDLLVHRESYNSVAADAYLGRIVASTRVTLGTERGISIRLEAAALELPQKRAVYLGLVVSELLTNAVKYAYPGRRGEVRIRLLRRERPAACGSRTTAWAWRGNSPCRGLGSASWKAS